MDERSRDSLAMTHVWDQSAENARRLGQLIGAYYRGLLEGGVPEALATPLTVQFQASGQWNLMGSRPTGEG